MKSLYKSLADFQQKCPTIHKATQGYGYTYADLPTIFEKINPLLKECGLGFYQAVNGTQLCTKVFHIESGEIIEASADIPQGVSLKGMNDFQVLGSAITYMRRYQLSVMLGIVTDKDTDAAGEQKPKLPELTDKHEKWKDVVKWLADGGNIESVKSRYYISGTTLKQLVK